MEPDAKQPSPPNTLDYAPRAARKRVPAKCVIALVFAVAAIILGAFCVVHSIAEYRNADHDAAFRFALFSGLLLSSSSYFGGAALHELRADGESPGG